MSSGLVSFLHLAYLAEVSIVLNLAYRELKFPELDKKIHTAIDAIIAELDDEAQRNNIMLEPHKEYQELQALLTGHGPAEGEVFEDNVKCRIFFVYLIKNRRTLKTVNTLILASVLFIVLASVIDPIPLPLNDTYTCSNVWQCVWVASLVTLILSCAIPLAFIRGATLCEYLLFGKPPRDKGKGKLNKLKDIMLLKIQAELNTGNNQARNFKAP